MSSLKVLITDHPWPDLDIETKILAPQDVELVDAPDADEETLVSLAADVDVIITCWGEVTERVIRSAKNCRLICRMGIGLNNIDIPTASELGIPVSNVPDYCIAEVADHTFALLLAMTRNVAFFHMRTKQHEYDLSAGPPMYRLSRRRLGLIGFGRIGRAVYERALAFGLDVVAHSESGNDYATNCQMVSLNELLTTSDIISLHAPLNEDTTHLLDSEAFEKIKSGTILINTSRGPLIDADALEAALASGKIAGAGLDVFEPEPPDLTLPLYHHENVIVTPHAAFVSEESVIELRERVADQILALLDGETPENIVNSEQLRQ